MKEASDEDITAYMVALLCECAAFETGLTKVRISALRRELKILTGGYLYENEFNKMLAGPSIFKPGEFLVVLQQVADLMTPIGRMMFRKAFEKILSADGPPSKGATEQIAIIRSILIY